MKITKKLKFLGEIVALSLVFALCLPNLSVPVRAEDGIFAIIGDNQPIFPNKSETISGNKGTALCTIDDNGDKCTIRLNNFELDPSALIESMIIYSGQNLEIIFSGTNNLICNAPYGIYSFGNIRFRSEDNGTLTIRTSDSMSEGGVVMSPAGILAGGSITVESGNINVITGNSEGDSIGIGCNDGLIMTGGSLNCSAGSSVSNNSYGFSGYSLSTNSLVFFDGSVTIGENVKSFVCSGRTGAVRGTVKNSIPGTGWKDAAGTGEGSPIPVNTAGGKLDSYKKIAFPPEQIKKIIAEASSFEGIYDGKPHGIEVKVTEPQTGAEIKYGTTEGEYDYDESPLFYSTGEHDVFYQVTAEGYETLTGRSTVKITPNAGMPVITLDEYEYVYDKKSKKPGVSVTLGTKTLSAKSDYKVFYQKGRKKAGTYKVSVEFSGEYQKYEKQEQTFVIKRADNTLDVAGKDKKIKYDKLSKKDQKIGRSKLIKVNKKGQGKLSYAISGDPAFTIDEKKGKVVVKSGLEKGEYPVTILVTADGGNNYKSIVSSASANIIVQ